MNSLVFKIHIKNSLECPSLERSLIRRHLLDRQLCSTCVLTNTIDSLACVHACILWDGIPDGQCVLAASLAAHSTATGILVIIDGLIFLSYADGLLSILIKSR